MRLVFVYGVDEENRGDRTIKTIKTIRIKTSKTDKTDRTFVRDRLNRPKVSRS